MISIFFHSLKPPHIVTLSVCYISNQIQVSTLRATEQSINGLDNHLDDIDILPLVETTDVIGLGNLSLVENHIDGTGMIYYIQPVAHVLTLTIYWQWLAMTDIVDEQSTTYNQSRTFSPLPYTGNGLR